MKQNFKKYGVPVLLAIVIYIAGYALFACCFHITKANEFQSTFIFYVVLYIAVLAIISKLEKGDNMSKAKAQIFTRILKKINFCLLVITAALAFFKIDSDFLKALGYVAGLATAYLTCRADKKKDDEQLEALLKKPKHKKQKKS